MDLGPAVICSDLVLKSALHWQPVGTSFRSECEVSENGHTSGRVEWRCRNIMDLATEASMTLATCVHILPCGI